MRPAAKMVWHDESGQDLIEYALLVGLAAIITAAIPFQSTMGALDHIYSRVLSVLDRFGSGGG